MERRKNLNIMLIIQVFLIVVLICTSSEAKIIYVDDAAAGVNDGSSWADAYNYLQDALAAALEGDEIRVAQGIYNPDLGGGNTVGDQRATFQLIGGVIIKGGYAGLGETDPNIVDVNLYKSILRGFNNCHIVTGSNVDETAILNGFTITGGHYIPNDCNDNPRGGTAIRIESGSPKILNCLITGNNANGSGIVLNNDSNSIFVGCVFSNNYGIHGTMENRASSPVVTNCTFELGYIGMENHDGSSPVLTNCVFRENSRGMENYTSSKTVLTNCTFEHCSSGMGNFSDNNVVMIDCQFKNNEHYGLFNESNNNLIITNCTFENNGHGGIHIGMRCNLTLSNCLFSGNSRSSGAGIYSVHSDLVLYNCKFIGNVATAKGGGIYNVAGNLRLYNCAFSGNSTGDIGGAIYSYREGLLMLHNCIINNNSADNMGGGIYTYNSSNVTLYNCTLSGNSTGREGGGIYNRLSGSDITLTNCIVWGNTPDQIYGSAIVSYSDIQGGLPGERNIDVDPLFADLDNGDYHLKSQAGRWDPISLTWVQGDVTSPCIDAGDPSSALSEEPQPNGQRINMGAYGGTTEASLSSTAN